MWDIAHRAYVRPPDVVEIDSAEKLKETCSPRVQLNLMGICICQHLIFSLDHMLLLPVAYHLLLL